MRIPKAFRISHFYVAGIHPHLKVRLNSIRNILL